MQERSDKKEGKGGVGVFVLVWGEEGSEVQSGGIG